MQEQDIDKTSAKYKKAINIASFPALAGIGFTAGYHTLAILASIYNESELKEAITKTDAMITSGVVSVPREVTSTHALPGYGDIEKKEYKTVALTDLKTEQQEKLKTTQEIYRDSCAAFELGTATSCVFIVSAAVAIVDLAFKKNAANLFARAELGVKNLFTKNKATEKAVVVAPENEANNLKPQ